MKIKLLSVWLCLLLLFSAAIGCAAQPPADSTGQSTAGESDTELEEGIENIVKITQSNFENEVLHSDKVVLLDFWASWCGPCQMLAPVLEEVAKERPDVKIGKVNVDEEPYLSSLFEIKSIPALFVVKEGEIVAHALGYRSKEQILELLSGV